MIFKNLLRRKARTLLTILGIGIGVGAIIGLGALTNGLEAGYNAMLSGSEADLVLSQPNAFDISLSSVDEAVGEELKNMPEVSEVSGMLQGWTQAGNEPFFFVFGYPENSFVLGRFQVIEGESLFSREARLGHGKPLLLGSAAAEVMDKSVGDTMRLTGSSYRVVGIYQTGDAFEDSGAVLSLEDAQDLIGKPRQVSLFYIQLKEARLRERFITRVERKYPDLSISGVAEFADQQLMEDMLRGYVWFIGGLAIVIGGVGMMNSQLMSVFERTREIGVLRAVGWGRRRVLWLILGEAIAVCLAGGLFGVGLGYLIISTISKRTVFMGASNMHITADLLFQAFLVVVVMGLLAGLYPAWRAARLMPVEALRYEGGSGGGRARRLPFGGMAVQSLWQRSIRTLLTLGVIGITVGSIMALEGILRGMFDSVTDMALGADVQIMIRQSDISDTELSAIDERVGEKIGALSEVESVSGIIFTAAMLPDSGGFFVLQGYAPNEYAIRRFKIVEGERLASNHQIILGKTMAEALKKEVGQAIELSGTRYRIVGIFESTIGWEELGGVVTLRDAQLFAGRPHKVNMFAVRVRDGADAAAVVAGINDQYPEVHAALSGDFVEQMPDMRTSGAMMNGISFIAILVGGVGVLNTMLMAVFERTREIGVLRALGWRSRAVLGMILREALLLGVMGGIAGIVIALGIGFLANRAPFIGGMLEPSWECDVFARAILVAMALGLMGGLYPAYRATRLQPVEALRYE